MSKKSIVLCLAMMLSVTVGAAAQMVEGPKVTSWSNSKTADHKTVFQVKPGQKITFNLKADGAEEYRWWVDKDAQKAVKGESFKWTVPGKKGMWKIHVTATNRPQEREMKKIIDVVKGTKENQKWDKSKIGDWGWGRWPWMLDAVYPSAAQKEWIVSTHLKEVKPGESIQAAIDSVPAEGGIVRLAAGTHNVPKAGTFERILHNRYRFRKDWVKVGERDWTKPARDDYGILLKDRKNLAILGAGAGKTTLSNTTDSCRYALLLLVKVSGITFRDFSITARKMARGSDRAEGVAIRDGRDIALSGVEVRNFSRSVNASAPCWGGSPGYHRTDNVVMSNCKFSRYSYGMNWSGTHNSVIKDTEFAGGFNDGISFNSASSLHVVTRCRCHNNANWGICTYSNRHFVLKDNICYNNRIGIKIQTYTKDVKVMDNICRNNGHPTKGGGGVAIVMNSSVVVPNDIVISNNLIYNNMGHGVYTTPPRRGASIKCKGAPFHISILSNTIFSNKGDGIVNRVNDFEFIVADNIIAGNAGCGVSNLNDKSKFKLSGNNVWNNSKGNYNVVTAGAGDMSVDPLFADPAKGDFHLKRKAGRWDPRAKKWVRDTASSPCIDAGDPKREYTQEPPPNGGRINMGAYGNTVEASKSQKRQEK